MPRASSLREVNIDLLFISKITMYMYPSCLVSSCLHFQLCSHHALSASMFVSFFICVLYFISHKSPALYLLSVHYLCSLFPSLPYLFFFFCVSSVFVFVFLAVHYMLLLTSFICVLYLFTCPSHLRIYSHSSASTLLALYLLPTFPFRLDPPPLRCITLYPPFLVSLCCPTP